MQSNTQHNSNEERGRNVIPEGQTYEHYSVMLSQALAQTKQKAEQARASINAARTRSKAQEYLYREGCRQSTQRCKAVKVGEQSPATAYQKYVGTLEQIETTELSPLSKAQDISLEATRIEGKVPPFTWNPHDLLLEKLAQQTGSIDRSHMADLATIHSNFNEMQCTPLPEEVVRPRITLQLENEEPRVLLFVNGMMSAREMIETAISEYLKQCDTLPTLLRMSPSTLLRMDPRIYWTTDETTYYQSLYHGLFAVEIDILLDHMTVQCEEAEQSV